MKRGTTGCARAWPRRIATKRSPLPLSRVPVHRALSVAPVFAQMSRVLTTALPATRPGLGRAGGVAARRPAVWSAPAGAAARPSTTTTDPRLCSTAITRAVATGGNGDDGAEPADIAAARSALTASTSDSSISGPQLRAAVMEKWGRDYAVLLARRGQKVFFQVLWKHAEQASYPLSEADHAATYDAVASYLSDWGAAGTVRSGIARATRRGPGYTGGGAARAISIPLDVDLSSARGAEFL